MPPRRINAKDQMIEVQNLQKNHSSDSDSDESSSEGHSQDDFGQGDCESDYEDQRIENRALKRRKREEARKKEANKVITSAYLPTNSKKLAACVYCRLVLNKEKWRKLESCPNCPQSQSGLKDTCDKISNVIGSVYPRVSWVAQYQGMKQLIPGFYAMAIYLNDDEDND